MDMKIKKELRPCVINRDQKALFHAWEQFSEVLPPSPLKGGHRGGEIAGMLAICELLDGRIVRVKPTNVKFLDPRHNEYSWEPEECY